MCSRSSLFFFFFNDTATTEIYTLSLHDALPIYTGGRWVPVGERGAAPGVRAVCERATGQIDRAGRPLRSEEHTSELQSQSNLVCRLLLEKKKYKKSDNRSTFSDQELLLTRPGNL